MLNLSGNELDNEGVQLFANALQTNSVRQLSSILPLHIHQQFYLIKTLTKVELEWSKIDNQRVEYLANALQTNTVRQCF